MAFGLAFLVAESRVEGEIHSTRETVFGAIIGILVGIIIFQLIYK
jgi:diacylglycerol kinase (ATP)